MKQGTMTIAATTMLLHWARDKEQSMQQSMAHRIQNMVNEGVTIDRSIVEDSIEVIEKE